MTTVFLVDTLVLFSDGRYSDIDLEADIGFLTILFGNICVHIYFMAKNTAIDVKLNCKKRKAQGKCCCFKKKVKKDTRRSANEIQIKCVKHKLGSQVSDFKADISEEKPHSGLSVIHEKSEADDEIERVDS